MNTMKVSKIVITGGAGFIGSHVYDYFAELYDYAEIIVFDKMTYAADVRNISGILSHSNHKLVVGDLQDFELLLSVTKDADLVINLAAESHVDNSFGNSFIFSRSNTLGTHVLLEACKRNCVGKIVHVSTDEVYGESKDKPYTELDSLNPTNPYSASKAAAEMLVYSYYKSFGLPVVTVRANNIYGIRQFPEKIIPKFILKSIKGEDLTLHGDGKNQRHYLSAHDFVSALNYIINLGQVGESYNIASDLELRNIEVAELILKHTGRDLSSVAYVVDRPFNDSRYAVDDTKLRALGWSPKFSLINDLDYIIRWYRDNLERYE